MKKGYKKSGLTLGVLGGMGPAATAEFLRILTERAPAEADQEHPVVYLISDAELPDRSTAILGLGEDPTARLQQDFAKLDFLGADFFAVPCNSAHYFLDKIVPLTKPLVHIIEESVLAAKRLNPEEAWLLGTLGTLQSGLYQKYAAKIGLPLYVPPEPWPEKVQAVIDLVKGNLMDESGIALKKVTAALRKEKNLPFLLACTETPLAYTAGKLPPEEAVSSLTALADACLAKLYVQE